MQIHHMPAVGPQTQAISCVAWGNPSSSMLLDEGRYTRLQWTQEGQPLLGNKAKQDLQVLPLHQQGSGKMPQQHWQHSSTPYPRGAGRQVSRAFTQAIVNSPLEKSLMLMANTKPSLGKEPNQMDARQLHAGNSSAPSPCTLPG